MPNTASELARRLAENAEAVCRHYLSNGRREGRYWLAGDARNTPGRSLYVRLRGPTAGRGAAGKWTDTASGEHGDLLDLIGTTRGVRTIGDALDEARRFLGLVRAKPEPLSPPSAGIPSERADGTLARSAPAGSQEAARRLFAMSKPISGTLAETYLRSRGIVGHGDMKALRFHPHCFCRTEPGSPDGARDAWPALVGAVTDGDGQITGLQRTWLDVSGHGKAPVSSPRRAMGHLLGHAVRFGTVCDVMAAGRGHRDGAVVAKPLPLSATGSRTLGRTPRLPPAPCGTAPALHRPRQRPGRALGGGQADGPHAGGRDRGAGAGAHPGRLERRSAAARTRCCGKGGSRATRPGGRGPVLATAAASATGTMSMGTASGSGVGRPTRDPPAGRAAPTAF